MREHPDMYLITDFKSEFRLVVSELARLYPDLIDRFIIQVYHGKQYAQAWNAGFHNVILTLYKAKDEELSEQHLSTFAADKMLVGFTVEKELLAENTSLKDALLNTGVPVYAHTVDDPDERDMLFQEGITAVYTDNLY